MARFQPRLRELSPQLRVIRRGSNAKARAELGWSPRSNKDAVTASGESLVRPDTLGEFLRARREQLSPAQVGLPGGERRRVPGLRREEVAMLAGLSVEYYLARSAATRCALRSSSRPCGSCTRTGRT